MKIALASDHAGAALKANLVEYVASLGHEAVDLGADGTCSVDYPQYALAAAEGVADGRYDRAILVCGTGLGMSMAANKVRGVRAALCHECYSARMAREHNDANVLCLGQRVVGTGLAQDVVRTFLETAFSEAESHRRRVGQIAAYETGAGRS
ncbi:MAG: ribose 5-phosphate isomerase B [Anaerolineae bacterium]